MTTEGFDPRKQEMYDRLFEKATNGEALTYEEVLEEPEFTVWMALETMKDVREQNLKDGIDIPTAQGRRVIRILPDQIILVDTKTGEPVKGYFDDGSFGKVLTMREEDVEDCVFQDYFLADIDKILNAIQALGVHRVYEAPGYKYVFSPGADHATYEYTCRLFDD